VSARLGEGSVVVPCLKEDHRPERMQAWVDAKKAGDAKSPGADALYPPWLLPQPLELAVRNNVPQYGGPLSRLTRIYRVETGWWEDGQPALRDYYIARSDSAGLVWIYRERPSRQSAGRWYLQGLYA
jgi:protein ImuB